MNISEFKAAINALRDFEPGNTAWGDTFDNMLDAVEDWGERLWNEKAPLDHTHSTTTGAVALSFGTSAERSGLAPTTPLIFGETDTGDAWLYMGGSPYDSSKWVLVGVGAKGRIGQHLFGQVGSQTVTGASAGIISPGASLTDLHVGTAGENHIVKVKLGHKATGAQYAEFGDGALAATFKMGGIPANGGRYGVGTFLLEGAEKIQAKGETADVSFWAEVIKAPVGVKALTGKGAGPLSYIPTSETVIHTTTTREAVCVMGAIKTGGNDDTVGIGAGSIITRYPLMEHGGAQVLFADVVESATQIKIIEDTDASNGIWWGFSRELSS